MPDPRTIANDKPREKQAFGRSWLDRLGVNRFWSNIADRGRGFVSLPPASLKPSQRATMLADALISGRGEASGAAIARELHAVISMLEAAERLDFYKYLASHFAPDDEKLAAAARAYLATPDAQTATQLADAAEPLRQELLRRMNMSPGGTAMLVAMRKEMQTYLRANPDLKPLDSDLRHLFSSWFNRGFLQLRRIDWQTPAAVLEKLITYEAVHEIAGWEDLRRRLSADRRCFAFFHPALPGEPLIFVEVALVQGLAASVQNLLARDSNEAEQRARAAEADTAIFYSISNCQDGLRGISFGNFLIKQVVEELKSELPNLTQFSTLSPVPGFRAWAEKHLPDDEKTALAEPGWWLDAQTSAALQAPILRHCAKYLTGAGRDPVAKFHLGNGARLERINWLGNPAERGMAESYGIMVNYLYDLASIEANHEAFVREGIIARSEAVEALLADPATPKTTPQTPRPTPPQAQKPG
ncbi:MAG: malonyl-CoA decarboxylase [Acidocella sp.]|nr:malonyl-CoA decarboxylase [Acidocella sp.]